MPSGRGVWKKLHRSVSGRAITSLFSGGHINPEMGGIAMNTIDNRHDRLPSYVGFGHGDARGPRRFLAESAAPCCLAQHGAILRFVVERPELVLERRKVAHGFHRHRRVTDISRDDRKERLDALPAVDDLDFDR